MNLKNVKLVIGNGYDLHCKLESSYSDFFKFFETKNNNIIKWIDKSAYNAALFLGDSINRDDLWNRTNPPRLEETSIWDVYFCMKYMQDKRVDYNWIDIERMILDSLKESDETDELTWDLVYKILVSTESMRRSAYFQKGCLLATFFWKKSKKQRIIEKYEFYNYLLEELKSFERVFGGYICAMRETHNKTENTKSSWFTINSKQTISDLGIKDKIVAIDSFNYDDIGISEYSNFFNNINGDVACPIFGVDSGFFTADDPRFIFSKTNRRMEYAMTWERINKIHKFDDVVVYGHSLGENDYNYFFPLLDSLDLMNSSSDKKIAFAYSIYKKNKESSIVSNTRLSIQKLFEAYAKYKGILEPNRLLDSLTILGKVLLYKI